MNFTYVNAMTNINMINNFNYLICILQQSCNRLHKHSLVADYLICVREYDWFSRLSHSPSDSRSPVYLDLFVNTLVFVWWFMTADVKQVTDEAAGSLTLRSRHQEYWASENQNNISKKLYIKLHCSYCTLLSACVCIGLHLN